MKDLYRALGVAEDADDQEIKKAFRRLAKDNHPDATGGDPEKTERFKEVNEAYDILGDRQKRAEYDRLRHAPVGADGIPHGFDASSFAQAFGGGGQGFRVDMGGGGLGGGLADLFSSLFGNQQSNPFGGAAGRPTGRPAGRRPTGAGDARQSRTHVPRGGLGYPKGRPNRWGRDHSGSGASRRTERRQASPGGSRRPIAGRGPRATLCWSFMFTRTLCFGAMARTWKWTSH